MQTSLLESERGASKPRIVVPPTAEIKYDMGDEVFALCEMAGLFLDPWQKDAIRLMTSVRPDNKWACFEYAELVARQNGKGAILEARALAGLFLFDEKLILWSAHEYKTAMEGFRRVRFLVENLIDAGIIPEDTIRIIVGHGDEYIERLDTKQRLKFVARSKSSGRGFSGDCNLIDETFAYTQAQHEALMPTMNARPNPQIIYTSSPPLDSDSGEVLFSLRKRAEAGGDDSLGYRDWGAHGVLDDLSNVDLDNRATWRQTNPAWGYRVTPETILRNRKSMSPEGFAREILGIWPRKKEGGGVIDLALWAALLDTASRRNGDVAVAVDISPDRRAACITLYGHREDGNGHLQILDYRKGTDWILPRLVEIRSALSPIATAMARGTHASLSVDLEKNGLYLPDDKESPARGDLCVLNASDMSAACGQILDAIQQGTLRHIGQQHLDTAVSGAKTRETGDTIAWSRKDSADISPLVAGTEARWAFESRLHLASKNDYDILDSIY